MHVKNLDIKQIIRPENMKYIWKPCGVHEIYYPPKSAYVNGQYAQISDYKLSSKNTSCF